MHEHDTIFLRMANTALARYEVPTDLEPQAVADMLRILAGGMSGLAQSYSEERTRSVAHATRRILAHRASPS